MFYHLYDGKNRREFESELIERFGSLVKIPLLESNRMESTKGTYAQEWTKWEQQLRDTLFGNSEYLNSIQVPFEFAVGKVLEQLRAIAKGDYGAPSTEKRSFDEQEHNVMMLLNSYTMEEPSAYFLHLLTLDPSQKDPKVEGFLKDKNLNSSLTKAHVTLAHKRSHGVAAVASYGPHLHQNVPIHMNALLFSDNLAALEVSPGVVDGEK
ncbi:tRNA ligase 1 [Sesamum angolense]|uniref:tRNA ligase 1 n=1 Tax=Sesamum angolense TaxID=2727404 RepID=A0AAE2C4L9_9LAMI|nr:tRNA ligase 1 [Sesamum angolense]